MVKLTKNKILFLSLSLFLYEWFDKSLSHFSSEDEKNAMLEALSREGKCQAEDEENQGKIQ